MSKVVLAFKSPYHQQYAETHAGGRLALALKFAGYDALIIRGAAKKPACLIVGSRQIALRDVHYLWGHDVFSTGKWLRRIQGAGSGHRSILRIGPAGESQVAYACVNVDTYRHFGRLGAGALMGAKNLKGMIVLGDRHLDLPDGRDYPALYKEIYQNITQSSAMRKYHDLGTPENLLVLNALKALPWHNLQDTHNEATESISGERFAEQLLLRQIACSGCPVGCIHVGLLRERFAVEHEFLYRQVSYDYEPIFAAGSMLGMTQPPEVLTLIEEIDRQGLDAISTGVALAWATEALQRGVITEKETLIPLRFGDLSGYQQAIGHLAHRTNEFYHLLGQGTKAAAEQYGGEDFACVLGQEMAGYASGEVYLISQAYGFRHSHLDSAGYTYDLQTSGKGIEDAVRFLLDEERRRIQLTCMVSCLFARKVYSEELLQQALRSLSLNDVAENLSQRTAAVQKRRWRLKFKSGFDPSEIMIPKRFKETNTSRGRLDEVFLDNLRQAYQKAIASLIT